jgi:hypothetical protein
MVHLDGLREKKGAHSLGHQVERKQEILVGIVIGDFGWDCCWRVKIAEVCFLF